MTEIKMKTLSAYNFDGEAALRSIIGQSEYGTIENAIARLTIFTNSKTFDHIGNRALFRIRRAKAGERRGSIIKDEGVVVCDNTSPTTVFLWANGLHRKEVKHVQFNHIYPMSQYIAYYTSLANICMTPAFLSKLTDVNESVIQLLRYRAFDLYDFVPLGFDTPEKPECYEALDWAPPGVAVEDIFALFRQKIKQCPKSAIAKSVNAFGF